ncbi:inorganic phosphate transporter [Nostoc sphaeroides]|uniref:TC.PIT, inorganic phosphate transporter, PiT family n=1 Tax=Nostoc sphaeroides CCNUC1 TaxID=2653204 RepID=A0A5P8W0D1_9NOSO|nr:inorganic phosphate transporter [Nostoc sphaeroides]MCC5630316.1 inorganic phosphate transporter family protein [Nostoc sphaeroides CHAB 2801]QFS46175.1 TC.PIT, inorganic phosphate transporter, PiT family [Nostoc sphaeroides CCNUC1]
MLLISLFIATLFLAYSNGANDNFKGVATLFGSRTSSYQTAILWATFTTLAGAVTATFLASTLIKNFSGKGLVPDAIANSPEFHLAVAIAAGLTVLIATLMGFPISTTHSLTGALVGAGLVAIGLQVNFAALGASFILPLLLSPIIAIPLGAGIYSLYNYIISKWNLSVNQKIIDTCHFLSAGIVSFTRGLNDTPKIFSLILVIEYFSIQGGMITIAIAMALGGLLNSQKVAVTMSEKITSLNHTQGLSANIVTGILVIAASRFGLPVSTTHVSVGSIFGVGFTGKKNNMRVFYQILLSWVLTLPTAAIISGITYRLLQG